MSPSPCHHPAHIVPNAASPPASPWAVFPGGLGALGSSIPLLVSVPLCREVTNPAGAEQRGGFHEKQMDKPPVVFLESRFPKTRRSSGPAPLVLFPALARGSFPCPTLGGSRWHSPSGMSAGHSGLLPTPPQSGHAQTSPHSSLWSRREKQRERRESRHRQRPEDTCSHR